MKRLLLISAALLFAVGCDTSVAFDAEGFKCDPGNVCPEGLSCVDGICKDTSVSGGGSGGGVGGGAGGGGGGTTDGGDLCSGVTCNAPPANTCADANTLRTYGTIGLCQVATGQCEYAPTDSACPAGCTNGTCPNSMCTGVVCNTPPAAACDDVNTLRTFTTGGTCNPADGSCTYSSTTANCPNGCGGGACLPAPLNFTQILPNVRSAVNAVDQVPNSGGDHVLAVGPAGYVAKWNGTNWATLSSNTTNDLNAVWLFLDGNNMPHGFIVGEAGTILEYNGTTLSRVNVTGLTADLVSVHGTDEDAVIAGGGTQIAVKDANGWFIAPPGTGITFNSIKSVFSENGLLRASGRCTEPGTVPTTTISGPCVIGWTSPSATLAVDTDTGAPSTLTEYVAVGPDAENGNTNFQYVSAGKTTRRYDYNGGANAAAFDTTNAVTVTEGTGIVAISRGETGLTGAAYFLTQTGSSAFGAIVRATKNGNNAPVPLKLQDIFNKGAMGRTDSGGVIVADSIMESATIGRRGPSTAVAGELYDIGEHWVAADQAIATGYTGMLLVSAFGDVASRTTVAPNIWRIARNLPAPTTGIIRDAAGGGPLAMVGENGVILRWSSALNTVTNVTSPTTQPLNAICQASATQFYAVGNGGVAVSIVSNGSNFVATLMVTPTTQDLNEVICNGTSAVAVGNSGTVLRLSGSSWVANTPAYPSSTNLTGVALTNGTLFVSGASSFARLEGNTWTTNLASRAGVAELRARSPYEIYGIAADTVVRFNGTAWTNVLTATSGLVGSAAANGRIVYVGSDGAVVEGQ